MTVLTTDRLVLRPFEDADIPAYTAIRLKPGVTRYLPSHTEDVAEARARSAVTVGAFQDAWARDGYGPWAVLRDGQLIGHLGLRYLPDMGETGLGETEILFLLDPDQQGRGYAGEAGRAALEHGFNTLGLTRIVAFALPANGASIAVLTRLGMARQPGLIRAFGLEVVRFELAGRRTVQGVTETPGDR